jgi:hypothetical protein
MKTLKLKIKEISDVNYIFDKQHNYSYCFRKLWKNIDKIDDIEYFKYLKHNFNLNNIELRSLISEVQTKYKQILTVKKKIEQDILDIGKQISYLKSKKKTEKITRQIFKLNKLLQYKNKTLSHDIVFGSKKLLSEISYLNNNKLVNKDKILIKKNEFINNRLLPVYFLGEANTRGNRFFKFDLTNNIILYKPNRKIKINIEFFNYKNYNKELSKLQELINNKEIAITIQLSKDYIWLMFDDEKFNGYSLNEKERRKEVDIIKKDHIDNETKTELIKKIYNKYYEKLRQKKLNNKLSYRYLSIDTNPDYIGCSIIDKLNDNNIKIVHTFCYNLTNNNLKLPRTLSNIDRTHFNNKRRHGISHIWKDIFETFKYYNCSYLVLEDLNINNKDLDNKVSNRKVNNIWYRTFSDQLINKYCNKLGIIKIEINPVYTSFIGNLNYNYIDPVNAAIEIGRRGITKYIKNSFYPPINIDTIMNTMSRLNMSRDVSFLKDHNKYWKDIFMEVKTSGLRYRATIEDISNDNFIVVNKLLHSNIKKYCFTCNNI